MGGLSYQYLVGPGTALAAVGVLALVLRWIYGSGRALPPPKPSRGDFGLLVPVATGLDAAAAEALRERLAGHAIRATVSPAEGGVMVLVFRADEPRARALLAASG